MNHLSLFAKAQELLSCFSCNITAIEDMNKEQIVTPESLNSNSDYSIYDGWKLKGWPIMTIVRGMIVMENGKVDKSCIGHGNFIKTNTK